MRIALQLDHEAHAALVGLVAQVGDLRDPLVVDERHDLLDQPTIAALLDLVGQLCDDDRFLAVTERFGVGSGLEADAAAAGFVSLADPRAAEDDAGGRKVRAGEVRHQLLDGDRWLLDIGDRRVDDLAQVMRRNVRRHPDCDPGGAVDEQIREARRQDEWFLLAAVVVGREIDGVHVEVAQHLHREARELRFGVAHGSRGVVVDRAEVPLSVDERVAHREVLGEADERVVNRRVAVRVVLAHDLTDDAGALRLGACRPETELAHRIKDATVYRLETVASIRECPRDDHRHRVVEECGAHLVLDRARLDVAAAQYLSGHD
jgi:hypothetical protein